MIDDETVRTVEHAWENCDLLIWGRDPNDIGQHTRGGVLLVNFDYVVIIYCLNVYGIYM